MLKSLIIVHRYLGVGLGLLMTIWCLSGFVMMYQGFPETTPDERVAGLERLDLSRVADASLWPLADADLVQSFEVEMVDGAPVAHVRTDDGRLLLSLDSGATRAPLDAEAVGDVAQRFADANLIAGRVTSVEPIRLDQWSISIWKREAPLWRATFDDPGATFVYINGETGRVAQDARPRERLLSWFGAIPHWLYPTMLRENQAAWYQVVIWSSLLGVFLTVTGLIVGFLQLRGASGRWFPFRRPMWLWHHVLGVFVGVLLLTWTASGLLTMQPWGLLESRPTVTRADLSGRMLGRDVKRMIDVARVLSEMGDLVQVRSAPVAGEPFAVMRWRDGSQVRIGTEDVAPLLANDLMTTLEARLPALRGANLVHQEAEDAYYYGHKRDVALPVFRIELGDADATRIYVDPTTGEVRRIADGTAKRYRWLESAFHSFDWPGIRGRPVWDIVVLPLLVAVTLACITGTWLSFSRVGRDVVGVWAWWMSRPAKPRVRNRAASRSGRKARDSA